ncbi:MAG: S8 family peptidase [Myxococcales bacterium]|nr:S8 family peptidase [Polyangiaceae bacterium]MDW8249714.1 S8 family peptidase [Myxococcales bacterium]
MLESSEDIPGQIVVDFRDDVGASDIHSVLTAGLGLTFAPTALEAQTRIQIATVPAGLTGLILAKLNADPRVEYAEPLARVHALFTPDDPLFKDQWHLARVGAPTAWHYATGRGVTVAVVDTGIACEDYNSFVKVSDLNHTRCVEGFNFINNTPHANDDQGHGTHVAGTIAQSTHNGHGAAGMAFHAKLMPVKVLGANGSGTTAGVADGIRWAADHGAQVINLSLGGPRPAQVLQKAIHYARAKGAVVIAAAGNSGGSVGYPGAHDGVIAVSASDRDDKIAKFSSRGPQVDIAAPGVDVVQQTICEGGKGKCERFPAFNGTSMATPHVSGAAAMLISQGVTDPDAIERILKGSARVIDPSDDGKALYGAGILDAAAAVKQTALSHTLTRLALLGVLAAWAAYMARKANGLSKILSPGFLLGALLTGPGLLFFAPLVSPLPLLALDVLARPLADLDLLLSPALHRWLPLANILLPFGLTTLAFGIKGLRPTLAGISLGTAAYLGSVLVLNESFPPVGKVLLLSWVAVNAVLCSFFGKFLLTEED